MAITLEQDYNYKTFLSPVFAHMPLLIQISEERPIFPALILQRNAHRASVLAFTDAKGVVVVITVGLNQCVSWPVLL